MDQQISKLNNEVAKLDSKLSRVEDSIRQMMIVLEEMKREIGSKQGRELYRQIDELHNNLNAKDQQMNQVLRDVTAIRKTVEYGDVNIKQIQQALALIYRNTDELEEHLIGEDRKTI